MKNRRQSQSPSSTDSSTRGQRSFFGNKHKRRTIRKSSNGTVGISCSGSFGSDQTDRAPWRVGNIRSAPPRKEEWWTETTCDSNDSQDYSDSEGFEAVIINNSSTLAETRKFHNCGLETWLQARKEWNRRTVESLPPKPTPAEYNQLVRGLTKHINQRTYELPRRMALSDLIDVYTDIWDGQGM